MRVRGNFLLPGYSLLSCGCVCMRHHVGNGAVRGIEAVQDSFTLGRWAMLAA